MRELFFIVSVFIVSGVIVFAKPENAEAKEPGASTGQAAPAIIQGDAISAEGSGSVVVMSGGLFCSGTLLSNDWVITAQHCQLDIAKPANVSVTMGAQSSVGAFAVNHPSLDFSLLRLSTPMNMNARTSGYRVPLYKGTGVSLEGKTLTCHGYGCSAYVPGTSDLEQCTGIDGTLRSAKLTVKQGGTDDYNFTVVKNSRGQVLAPGDSGGGCFVDTVSGLALAGVNHAGSKEENYLGIPENWREWALAYVNGTAVPLPQNWYLYSHNRKTFLTPPLPDNFVDSYSWNPCPDGKNYSYSPSFDLEQGRDFISIKAGGSPVTLTGRATTMCRGVGAITVSVKTNGSNQSTGLIAMPVQCNFAGPSSEAPQTNVAPALVAVGNNILILARSLDGRVMYQRAMLGQAGLCWGELEGNGRTDTAPAAAAVGSHIYVAVKGSDGRVAINQSDLDHPFGQWFPSSGMTTNVAPAVASVGNSVYLFATSVDGRIMFNRAVAGQGGAGWQEVQGNGRTDSAPAAAAVGNHIFVAVRGADGWVAINQADDGQPFGQWFPSNGVTTNVAPAVAGVGNSVYFFATSVDGRIMFNRAVVGQGGDGWKEVAGNGRTNSAPAAAGLGDHVFVAIKNASGGISINQADLGHSFGQWFP